MSLEWQIRCNTVYTYSINDDSGVNAENTEKNVYFGYTPVSLYLEFFFHIQSKN